MSSEANHQPPEFVKHWAKELGSSEKSLVQLQGGINNRVFRCGEAHNQWVIKGYAPLDTNQRNCMRAEVEFLRYAQLVAPGRTPELIEIDNERRCVVLEYINGKSYTEGESPSLDDQQEALSFFHELNTQKEAAKELITMDASEGFLRLTEHMDNIYWRIESMDVSHLPINLINTTDKLINTLNQKAHHLEKYLHALLVSGEVIDALDPNLCCVSPSDFGFHNALKTPKGIKFIDFEFAGWDDPAKAEADFFLQPKIPVNKNIIFLFSGWLKNSNHEIKSRLNILSHLLHFKWICIILGVLNPNRLQKILSLNEELNIEELVRNRIILATNYLSDFREPP